MKTFRIVCAVLLLFGLLAFTVYGDEAGSRLLSFTVYPVADMGIGSYPAFPDYGLKASLEYWLPSIPLSFFGSFMTLYQLLDYLYSISESPLFSIQANGGVAVDSFEDLSGIRAIYGGLGLGANIPLVEGFSLKGHFEGGYFAPQSWVYQSIEMDSGFYLGGQLGVQLSLGKMLSLGIGGRYARRTATVGYEERVYQSLGAFVEASVHIQGEERVIPESETPPSFSFNKRTTYVIREIDGEEVREEIETDAAIDIADVQFSNVFPVLYKYYDDNPLGLVTIKNDNNVPATDVNVSLYVDEYMNDPWLCAEIAEVPAQSEVTVDLYALFNKDIMETTERTKVSSKTIVEYTVNDQRLASERVDSVRVERRNAISWDDDRRAAAYITTGDPVVLRLANNISSWISDVSADSINKNLTFGIGVHEAMRLHGISYVIDPTTPYIELSENTSAIDFLKFPRETLSYLAGDCDDLSILYSSLMEAVGISTAFITIPGHIYMAFSLGLPPEEARKTFSNHDDFIFRDGQTWLPFEITKTDGTFLEAWREGAREWREFSAKDQAQFYPNSESWLEYEPVQMPGDVQAISLPDKDELVEIVQNELNRYVERELYSRVADLEERIERTGNPKYMNRLAVLYARYGLYDKAIEEFERTLEQRDYLPALVNIGNIHYMKDDPKKALMYYERAYIQAPDNAKILLSLARTHNEMENYGTARDLFEKLQEVDSKLASEYIHLMVGGSSGGRASDAGSRDSVLWIEDESEAEETEKN